MFTFAKFHKYLFLIKLLIILSNCQFNEPTKNHGILYLEKRLKQLEVNITNKNDVINKIGFPHSKSIDNDNIWIYFERVLTKGSYHKLGQPVLKESNVALLEFNKYGILNKKSFFNKDEIKKLKFAEKNTENEMTKKSFVEKFLSSVKAKMYGNK
jgi:outer membrane protein assembly factor BamE (lipoprotein component of BamABCDE complex)